VRSTKEGIGKGDNGKMGSGERGGAGVMRQWGGKECNVCLGGKERVGGKKKGSVQRGRTGQKKKKDCHAGIPFLFTSKSINFGVLKKRRKSRLTACSTTKKEKKIKKLVGLV